MLTATAAGALLGALWFVPSANATSASASHESPHGDRSQTSTATSAHGGRLADTGGFDTTPYVIGGTAFLGLGAGFVAFSARRERAEGAGGAAY
ncbi:LPXTG cell wall anchor domain-containing protein [Streptomyces sp. NPDC003006]